MTLENKFMLVIVVIMFLVAFPTLMILLAAAGVTGWVGYLCVIALILIFVGIVYYGLKEEQIIS